MHPTADISVKEELRDCLRAYLEELCLVSGESPASTTYPYLDFYWVDPARYPFVQMDGERIAAFCLIRRVSDHFEVAEFWVRKDLRKQGRGLAFVTETMSLFAGPWQIHYSHLNEPAKHFWDKVSRDLDTEVTLLAR